MYQIDDILIDPGVPLRKIKKALNFQLSKTSACLISHRHMDHAVAASEIMRAGIDVYCGPETAASLGLAGHRLHILKPNCQVNIGGWIVKPFPLIHDVENFGFLLARGDEKLLYVIDTNYIPFRFSGLTHIMIGVNFSLEILRENVTAGTVDIERAKRTIKNHMSLETAKAFFEANDMSSVREIHLLHLSSQNADADSFKSRIERVTGKPVYVANG